MYLEIAYKQYKDRRQRLDINVEIEELTIPMSDVESQTG